MFGFLLMLLIAALVGWIADMVVPGDFPLGWIGSIVAGLVGAYIGGTLLGELGPQIGGIYIVPAIIGAIILSFSWVPREGGRYKSCPNSNVPLVSPW